MSLRGMYSLEQLKVSGICDSPRGNAFLSDELQKAVIGKNKGYGYPAGKLDFTFQIGASAYFSGLRLVVFPKMEAAHFIAGFYRQYNERARNYGANCQRATQDRSCTSFKFVNAPGDLVGKPQKQGRHAGNSMHQVRALQDDFTAISMSGNGRSASPELNGAKVKVVAAGAGASAIVNFCQQSSLLPRAQFWYSPDLAQIEPVLLSDGGLQNSVRNGGFVGEGEKESVFVVLGVGSSISLGKLPKQLKAVRLGGSLAVGVVIQPFVFEGAKRLEQAYQLIDGLLGCTNILLVVEQDGLLRRDIVTVDEASALAKNAILLSIKSVAELLSGKANVSLDAETDGSTATSEDLMKILQQAGKAWLGSGKGNTSKEAIEMAVAEAPIADYRPFGAKRLVLCTVASAVGQTSEEVEAWKSFLHQTLGPEMQLIVNTVENPMLEDNVKLATLIIARVNTQQVTSQSSDKNGYEYGVPSMIGINPVDQNASSKQGIYLTSINTSNGANFIPLESSPEQNSSPVAGASVASSGVVSSIDSSSLNQGKSPVKGKTSRPTSSPPKAIGPLPHRALGKRSPVKTFKLPFKDDGRSVDSGQFQVQAPLASAPSQKLRLAWEAGPSSDIAEAWAQARAEAREPAQVTSVLDVSLPLASRFDLTSESLTLSPGVEGAEAVPVDPDALPRNRMMAMGLEAMRDMYNVASALVMGRDMTEEQESLSQRASSMLESERSSKKLTPLVEMSFKNGSYKGRCLHGLPEGKGRLSFSDGSFYDGQWKQGKRAGSGAFYYTNGDMFQGSWRDDVMHGKGWMYYFNGDRLYANFRKGRADGEGRFYSAQGDVFFGQFQENLRHGEFLYIEACGVRWSEIWENGILKSRIPADS